MTFYIDIKGKLVNTSTDRSGYKFRKIRVNTIPFLHSFSELEFAIFNLFNATRLRLRISYLYLHHDNG